MAEFYFSDGVQKALKGHWPEGQDWGKDRIKAFCRKAGVKVPKRVDRWDYRIRVRWEFRHEDGKIVFYPVAHPAFTHLSREELGRMLEVAGLKPVAVELPEEVIQLPKAPWDWTPRRVESLDIEVGEAYVLYLMSEAREEVAKFCHILQELVKGG